jgi:hypothetical protein
MKWILAIAALLGAGVSLEAAPLVACPDCGGKVSARAVFCPHCGAPGEAIAEIAAVPAEVAENEGKEAEGIAEGEVAEESTGDNVLFARVNGRDVYALPVAWPDGPCVILPAAALAGLETLELIQPSTALPVPYGAPAVSRDGRLVRLPLAGEAGGIAFHPLAGAADGGFVFDPDAMPPEGAAPVAAVRVPGADDIPLSAAILWQTVSPRALKSILNQKESP